MKRLLFAGLAAGAWSSCALAADLGPYTPPPRYEPVYEPVRDHGYNWQGLYLGVNAGYGWGNDNALSFVGPGGSIRRHQSERLVRRRPDRLQRAVQLRSCSASKPTCRAPTSATRQRLPAAAPSRRRRPTSNGSRPLRGRVGYAAGPALLYVTGGWAFADVNTSVTSDQRRRHRVA